MRKIPGLILMLTLTAASAEVYRWTDDKGVVHYGDKPLAANAKPVELPPLQTYSPSVVAPAAAAATTGNDATVADDGKPPAIRISSPAPDETLRDTEGQISVVVEVSLKPSQGLLYFLDGVQQNAVPTVSTAFLIENVERGEHTVSAAVVGAKGKPLSRSEPVTVHMKPPIAQPPPPPPRPPPATR